MFWKLGGKGWLIELMNLGVTKVIVEQPRLRQVSLFGDLHPLFKS